MLRLLTSSFLCAAALAAKDSHDDHNHGGGSCASDHCKAAFQTVLMAHDTCKDEQLPKTLETKLHFFEDGCETHWCNTVTKPFEPMAVECGTGHDHGHGHGSSEPCGCWAKKYDFPIDCANAKTTVAAAVDYLQKNICENKKEDEACKKNFAILNTHHDYCYHDDLPTNAEIAIHSYEDKFASCIIGRQFSPKVSNCPIVDCTKMDAMDAALKELDEECKPEATTTTPATKDSTPTTTKATTKATSAASSPSYVVAGFTFLSGVMAYVL